MSHKNRNNHVEHPHHPQKMSWKKVGVMPTYEEAKGVKDQMGGAVKIRRRWQRDVYEIYQGTPVKGE